MGCPNCRMCQPAGGIWQLLRFYLLTNLLGMLLSAFLPKCPYCGHPQSAHD